jgi:hypothetical protein
MRFSRVKIGVAALAAVVLTAVPARAGPFFFSTGDPDGKMATASRPASAGKIEIESADDFALTQATAINSLTFTGLVPTGANVQRVVVEIYRVFPKDSDVTRTSGPPTFSTNQVPTRVNSPSDVAFASRDSSMGDLSFSTAVLQQTFTANNSVLNGIHPKPNQQTHGEGPVTGQEVQFNVNLSNKLTLPGDHYFFVPQVQLDNGDFFWLSAPKPIVAPGTPFPPGFTDLQEWIRNEDLAPDWLRVGTDIVGMSVTGEPAPTFNATFSLSGETVPEPGGVTLVCVTAAGIALRAWRRKSVP